MPGSMAKAGFKVPPPAPMEARQTVSNIPVFDPAGFRGTGPDVD
jgi:hypothetical protein